MRSTRKYVFSSSKFDGITKAPFFKMLQKSVKADGMCFSKSTKKRPQRASVVFQRLADGLC